jgi:hypothetical protein
MALNVAAELRERSVMVFMLGAEQLLYVKLLVQRYSIGQQDVHG